MNRINAIFTKIKSNWINAIILLFNLSLSIVLTDSLIANLRELNFGLSTYALSISICVVLSYIYTSWHEFNRIEKNEATEAIVNYALFSREWFSIEFPALLSITIIYTPIIILFWIVFTNEELMTTTVVGDPSFQSTADWANILLAIGLLAQSLREINQITEPKIKQLLSLLQGVGLFLGFALYAIWTVHLQEIN